MKRLKLYSSVKESASREFHTLTAHHIDMKAKRFVRILGISATWGTLAYVQSLDDGKWKAQLNEISVMTFHNLNIVLYLAYVMQLFFHRINNPQSTIERKCDNNQTE